MNVFGGGVSKAARLIVRVVLHSLWLILLAAYIPLFIHFWNLPQAGNLGADQSPDVLIIGGGVLIAIIMYSPILLGSAAIIGLVAAASSYLATIKGLSKVLQLFIGTIVGAATSGFIEFLLRNTLSEMVSYSFRMSMRGTPPYLFTAIGTITALAALLFSFRRRPESDDESSPIQDGVPEPYRLL